MKGTSNTLSWAVIPFEGPLKDPPSGLADHQYRGVRILRALEFGSYFLGIFDENKKKRDFW